MIKKILAKILKFICKFLGKIYGVHGVVVPRDKSMSLITDNGLVFVENNSTKHIVITFYE